MDHFKAATHSTLGANSLGRMLSISGLLLLTVLVTLASLLPSSARAQVQVQGSVGGQLAPGVYGRVDFGSAPPPAVIYQQPIIVQQQPVYLQAPVLQTPIYLAVPPGHSRNRNQWHRYCARYNACAQPVYFVRPARAAAPRYYRHNNGHGHAYGHPNGRAYGHPSRIHHTAYVQPPHAVYLVKAKHGKGHHKHGRSSQNDD